MKSTNLNDMGMRTLAMLTPTPIAVMSISIPSPVWSSSLSRNQQQQQRWSLKRPKIDFIELLRRRGAPLAGMGE